MNATTGLASYADFTGAADTDDIFDALLAIIPDPDAPHGTGAVAGGGFLDEMSPGAAAQIRVELLAAKALAAGVALA